MYRVIFTKDAQKGLKQLHKKSPHSINKLKTLVKELEKHPREGTGHIEILKYQKGIELYSRRINKEHRLVYTIEEEIVVVEIISTFGHYNK